MLRSRVASQNSLSLTPCNTSECLSLAGAILRHKGCGGVPQGTVFGRAYPCLRRTFQRPFRSSTGQIRSSMAPSNCSRGCISPTWPGTPYQPSRFCPATHAADAVRYALLGSGTVEKKQIGSYYGRTALCREIEGVDRAVWV